MELACEPVIVCEPTMVWSKEPTADPALDLLPELATFVLVSEIAEDWELCRRPRAGLRREAELDAMNFRPVGVDFFSLLADNGAGPLCISRPVPPVLPEDVSASLAASSSDSCGEMNRAVGRGPDADGPLDFFKIG